MSKKEVRVQGPADLAGLLPTVLGYIPEESLTFVGVGDDNAVKVTGRVDLDGGLDTLMGLKPMLKRERINALLVFLWTDDLPDMWSDSRLHEVVEERLSPTDPSFHWTNGKRVRCLCGCDEETAITRDLLADDMPPARKSREEIEASCAFREPCEPYHGEVTHEGALAALGSVDGTGYLEVACQGQGLLWGLMLDATDPGYDGMVDVAWHAAHTQDDRLLVTLGWIAMMISKPVEAWAIADRTTHVELGRTLSIALQQGMSPAKVRQAVEAAALAVTALEASE